MSGAVIGDRGNIGDHAFIESGAILGNNVTIKNGVLIWDGIVIEDDVFIGPGVIFTNDRYPRSPRMPEAKHRYSEKATWLLRTRVGSGCSIGAGAIVAPGIELGEFSMIGAGSLVTRSVPPFSLILGNPARRVAEVCVCGQKLAGSASEATCQVCGQSGAERLQRLNNTALMTS
jgi:acetyltransferase-like isoleucine patch superfamily enzyme